MSYELNTTPDWESDYKELEKKFFAQQAQLREARQILSDFVCSQISYMTVNNLGDPFKQQDVRRAAKFLLDN